jgi:hypothetical protein
MRDSCDRPGDRSTVADLEIDFAWRSGNRLLQRGTTYGIHGASPDSLLPGPLQAYPWASIVWRETLDSDSEEEKRCDLLAMQVEQNLGTNPESPRRQFWGLGHLAKDYIGADELWIHDANDENTLLYSSHGRKYWLRDGASALIHLVRCWTASNSTVLEKFDDQKGLRNMQRQGYRGAATDFLTANEDFWIF